MLKDRIFIIIVVFSVILRVWMIEGTTWIPASDQRDYYTLGKNLYDGEGYIQIYNGESSHYQGMTLRAYRMPGYPFFLSGWFQLFGPDPHRALYANILFDAGTVMITYLLALPFGVFSARMAAFFVGINILFTPLLMTESSFTFLFTGLIYLLAGGLTIKSRVMALASGVLFAITVFFRPVALALSSVAIFQNRGWIFKPHRILFFLPLICFIIGWSTRNFIVLDSFIPFSTNFGAHNAPDFGIDKQTQIFQLREARKSEGQINSDLTRQIFDTIRDDPKQALIRYWDRVVMLFSLEPVSELRSLLWAKALAPIPTQISQGMFAMLPAIYILAALGAVLGCILGGSRYRFYAVVFLSFILFHGVISNGNVRFIAPLFPLLAVSATLPIQFLINRFYKTS